MQPIKRRGLEGYPLLSREQELALIEQAQKDLAGRIAFKGEEPFLQDGKAAESRAMQLMLLHNERLSMKIACRIYNRLPKKIKCLVDVDDLAQTGNFGLYRAVLKFNKEKNCRFSTYATLWVRHVILRALTDEYFFTLRAKAQHCQMETLFKKFIEEAGAAGVAFHKPLPFFGGMSIYAVGDAAFIQNAAVSLENKVNSRTACNYFFERPLIYEEVIADSRIIAPDAKSERDEEAEMLPELIRMAGLEARSECILKRRFGLDGDREYSFQELGDEFGISKQRVQQLEQKSLCKLRRVYFKFFGWRKLAVNDITRTHQAAEGARLTESALTKRLRLIKGIGGKQLLKVLRQDFESAQKTVAECRKAMKAENAAGMDAVLRKKHKKSRFYTEGEQL